MKTCFYRKVFTNIVLIFFELTRHGVTQKVLGLIEGNSMYFEIIGNQKLLH